MNMENETLDIGLQIFLIRKDVNDFDIVWSLLL